jgi:hypothetical protein
MAQDQAQETAGALLYLSDLLSMVRQIGIIDQLPGRDPWSLLDALLIYFHQPGHRSIDPGKRRHSVENSEPNGYSITHPGTFSLPMVSSSKWRHF